MLAVRVDYFGENKPICDVCNCYLVDVVFASRQEHLDGRTFARLRKAWQRNLKERDAKADDSIGCMGTRLP